MATQRRAIVLFAGGVVLAATFIPISIADAQGSQMCCFRNWRYSGTCVVQLGTGQRCGDVLSAINNPMDVSTYCGGAGSAGFGGSNVRGGWTMLDCGGEGQTGAGGPDRTRPPQAIDQPPAPSTVRDARSPQIVAPGKTTGREPEIRARQPTFIQPVQPTTISSDGPTVITLR